MNSARAWAIGLCVVLTGLFLVRLVVGGAPTFFLDDAFITIHNARWFFAASDPAFPGQPPLSSATSIVHTAMVAVLVSSGLSAPWALEATLWLAAYLYLLGIAAFCRARGCPPLETSFVCLLSLGAMYTPFNLASGLETSLAMAGVMWAIVGAHRDRLPWSMGLLIGVLPFVRPELIVVSLCLAWRYLSTWRVQGGIAILAAALPWVIVRAAVTGQLVPTTMAAKAAFLVDPMSAGARLAAIGSDFGTFLLLGLPLALGAALGWVRHATSSARLTVVVTIASVVLFAWPTPHVLAFNCSRYLMVIVPWLLAGVVRLPPIQRRAWLAAAATWALLLWDAQVTTLESGRYYARRLVEVSRWVGAHDLPTPILVHDVGAVSELTTKQFVDIVGIKTPWTMAVHQRITRPSWGGRRSDALGEIACRSNARTLVALRSWEDSLALLDGIRARGIVARARHRTGDDLFDYTVYELTGSGSCSPTDFSANSATGLESRDASDPRRRALAWRRSPIPRSSPS